MSKKQPQILSKEKINYIRTLCKKAEQNGKLNNALLKIIYEKKWFKIFLPKKYNGLELTLPEALKLEEHLAYIDGSLGWTVTLCAGANLFAGYINHKNTATIFSSKKICFGGSGAATGIAAKVNGGYKITGHWRYATGAPHLTHFTANCIVEENGQAILQKDGTPTMLSFFFKRKDVIIHKDWDTMGLKATAGHSFSVKNLTVPASQSFRIDTNNTFLDLPIYRYPFMPLAQSTIAINTLGMTRHFMELALAVLEKRKSNIGNSSFQKATHQIKNKMKMITSISTLLYQWIDASWQELLTNGKLSKKQIQNIGKISRRLVITCRTAAVHIYPYCGLATTTPSQDINQVFRNLFTASQHSLLTFPD